MTLAPPLPHRIWHKEWLIAAWEQWTRGRTRLQLAAIAVLSIGAVLIVVESASISRHITVHQGVELVHFALHHASGKASMDDTPIQEPSFSASRTTRVCYYTHDVGLVKEIRQSSQVFCRSKANGTEGTVDPTKRTEVSVIDLNKRGLNMRAVVFKNDLELDFRGAQIHRPIASLADDGGAHNPRFNWHPNMISCGCDELQTHATNLYNESNGLATLRLWDPQLVGTSEPQSDPSTVCASPRREPNPSPTDNVVQIREKTILISRRDDHNPFFQISNALNAWLLMMALGWNRDEVRVVHMDGGYASPVDELHHKLLSSPAIFEILRGRESLVGKKYQFTNHVLLAPHEVTGPMMQHLNDYEPCFSSHLINEFRAQSLAALDVSADNFDTTHQITVTIISRRNYSGRKVQRRWHNEDQVLQAMRLTYPSHNGVPIVVQSVDFVDSTLAEQMEISLTSDVVIGMHGAGMVNVLWTKPETLVVEIFPKKRFRWGYRNLCQYVGCDWHQFRGGSDTGRGDNASDKTTPVDEWMQFFSPLFGNYLHKLAASKVAPSAQAQQQLRQ